MREQFIDHLNHIAWLYLGDLKSKIDLLKGAQGTFVNSKLCEFYLSCISCGCMHGVQAVVSVVFELYAPSTLNKDDIQIVLCTLNGMHF